MTQTERINLSNIEIKKSSSNPAEWLLKLDKSFSCITKVESYLFKKFSQDQYAVGFLTAIAPLLSQGREQLHSGQHRFHNRTFTIGNRPLGIHGLLQGRG